MHKRRDSSSGSSDSDSDESSSISSSQEDGKNDGGKGAGDDRRLAKRQKRDEVGSGYDRLGFKVPAAPAVPTAPIGPEAVREDWMMAPPRASPSGVISEKSPAISSDPNPTKVEFKIHPREINPQLNPDSPLNAPPPPSSSASWRDRARQRQDERADARSTSSRHGEHQYRDSSSRDRDSHRNSYRHGRDYEEHDSRSSRGSLSDLDSSRDSKIDRFGRDVPPAASGDSERRASWRKDDDNLRSKQRDQYEKSQKEALSVMQKPLSAEEQEKKLRDEAEIRELETVDINRLGSQIVKAELVGNTDLAKSLKAKLERAKLIQEKGSAPLPLPDPSSSSSNIVIMSDIDSRGRSRSATTDKSLASRDEADMAFIGKNSKKRVDSHDNEGERQRYFADDDVSLQDVIQRERRSGGDDMDKAFADNITRNNRFKESAMDVMNYDDDDVDYALWESREKKQSREKLEQKERARAVADFKRMEATENSCYYCYSTKKIPKHLILSLGEHCYLAMPERGQLVDAHVFIVPSEHCLAMTMVEDHVWREVELFMASLTKMFQARGQQCLFIETVMNLKHRRHTVLECVPVPATRAEAAPAYFRKAISEAESEWAQHKKIIETKGKGIRRSIPPNFSYFFVQFGVGGGYAHVIEDSQKFPKFFGREVIAGLLQLDAEQYIIKPKKKSFEEERKNVLAFLDAWKDFDWTVELDGGNYS